MNAHVAGSERQIAAHSMNERAIAVASSYIHPVKGCQ
jgi:hypothetical protein